MANYDLSATIEQSAADKLTASISYPFNVFDHTWPFEGLRLDGAPSTSVDYLYTKQQVTKLLQDADRIGPVLGLIVPQDTPADLVNRAVLASCASVVEQAKACLDASLQAGNQYQGPDPADLKSILAGGVRGLANIAGIQVKVHLAWFRADLAAQPAIGLGSPTITVGNVQTSLSATAELWWYHPSFHCSRLCTNWSTTWGWDRVTHVTVDNVKVAGAAHANVSTSGSSVLAQGVVDRLRLDYPILQDIPLEGIANDLLKKMLVFVFDAGQYVATVPVLRSRFSVSSVSLPPGNGRLEVDISVKEN